jgi:polar amino acid transport system ATP-binding protein
MIEVQGIHKHFGPLDLLQGIDLSVARGEVACVIGPSGGGKSALLRRISNLAEIEQGRILIDGQPIYWDEADGRFRAHSNRAVTSVRAPVGMVFQPFKSARPPKFSASRTSRVGASSCGRCRIPSTSRRSSLRSRLRCR